MKTNNALIGYLNGIEMVHKSGNSILIMEKFISIRDRLIKDRIEYDLIIQQQTIFLNWIENLFPDEYPEILNEDDLNSAYGWDFYFDANPYGN